MGPAAHFALVSKKPRKVEEPAEPKAADTHPHTPVQNQPAEFKPRYVDEATAKVCMDKIFRVHGDLLRRLAEYDRNG